MFALQVIWDPKEIKPPDGVHHEFPGSKGPGLPVGQQPSPWNPTCRTNRVAFDVRAFGGRAARMLVRSSIQRQPERQPKKSERASKQKRPSPAKVQRNPRDEQGRNDGADVRTRIEDARRQRSFFFGEPLSDALDTGWK